jgi:hypothetical protein
LPFCHFYSFQDSTSSPQPTSSENSSNDEEPSNGMDLEWDNSWVQLQTIPEETQQEVKNWESTGEGAACLTFIHGQALFQAQKLKEKTSTEMNEMTSVQIHGVPIEEEVQPNVQSHETTVEEIHSNENLDKQQDDFPDPPTELELSEMADFPDPPTELELTEMTSNYQTAFL